jgi:hypothetical protein
MFHGSCRDVTDAKRRGNIDLAKKRDDFGSLKSNVFDEWSSGMHF